MTVITDIKQVLRQRGRNWQIITDDFILKEFLSHDYDIWVRWGEQYLIDENIGGGDVIEWEFVDDEVHLQASIFEDDDTSVENWKTCKVKKEVLLDAINKKAGTRR